jgi:hypothetical protein
VNLLPAWAGTRIVAIPIACDSQNPATQPWSLTDSCRITHFQLIHLYMDFPALQVDDMADQSRWLVFSPHSARDRYGRDRGFSRSLLGPVGSIQCADDRIHIVDSSITIGFSIVF